MPFETEKLFRLIRPFVETPSCFGGELNGPLTKEKTSSSFKSGQNFKNLTFVSFNCRSIRNKTQSILSYLDENKIDVACFQETWLDNGDSNILVEIKEYGYHVINQPRQLRRGGGVLMLYKPTVQMSKLSWKPGKPYKTFEYLLRKLTVEGEVLTIVNLYRAPYSAANKTTVEMFLVEFENF